jgi:hypothetical protein
MTCAIHFRSGARKHRRSQQRTVLSDAAYTMPIPLNGATNRAARLQPPNRTLLKILTADLVDPVPKNFHWEALSIPLTHAAILVAEYRSPDIDWAFIRP